MKIPRTLGLWAWVAMAAGALLSAEDEPPALNPFGPRVKTREDALPGFIEMSDGTVHPGNLYLTRDTRLKIYDQSLQRQREIPLRVIQKIDCTIEKEWMEKEWRFRENANDQKIYTGRRYPARSYFHTITLQDGRKISGPLAGVLYVDAYQGKETRKILVHKRHKGELESELKSLVYARTVELGEEALQRGLLLADQRSQQERSPGRKRRRP